MIKCATQYRLEIMTLLNKTPVQRAKLLYPGVKYSEVKNLVQDVRISDLAKMCGLSVVAIHKICREYSGVIVKPGRCVHSRKVIQNYSRKVE